MHILLVIHYYPPEIGAPQRRWDAFVGRWIEAGHEVTVVAPLPHYPNGNLLPGHSRSVFRRARGSHGETVIRVPFLPRSESTRDKMVDQVVAALSSIPAGLHRNRFDVVVTSCPGMPSLAAGAVISRLLRVPHVIEMRDAWPDLIGEAVLGEGRATRIVSSLVTSQQRRASHVVTVSERFAEVLRGRLGRAEVTAISNGIDLSKVPVLPSRPIEGPLRVLYLGTIGVSQGLGSVIDAAALVGGDVVQLRVVGGGVDLPRLKDLAARLKAPVTFEAQVSGRELWSAYAEADTVVVSLRNWPAFEYTVPSKLYEIFATGNHVSACLSGEAADLVHESRSGFVVPPEDAHALAGRWSVMHSSQKHLGLEPGSSRAWVASNAQYEHLGRRYLDVLTEVIERHS